MHSHRPEVITSSSSVLLVHHYKHWYNSAFSKEPPSTKRRLLLTVCANYTPSPDSNGHGHSPLSRSAPLVTLIIVTYSTPSLRNNCQGEEGSSVRPFRTPQSPTKAPEAA